MRKILVIMTLIVLLLLLGPLAWAWEMERPYTDVSIKDRVDNSYTNGEASVGLGVAIGKYIEDFPDYGGADFLTMNVSMTANSRRGIEYDYYYMGGFALVGRL